MACMHCCYGQFQLCKVRQHKKRPELARVEGGEGPHRELHPPVGLGGPASARELEGGDH